MVDMKEFKGTKGKWKAENRFDFEANINTETHRIAEVKYYPKPIDRKLLDPSREEGLANAKLIASAPDLLEALQEMYDQFKILSYDTCQDDALILAEQAIKKALE